MAEITSKFIGESEKLLELLFDLAKEKSPSVLLIDEMDSLGRKHSGKESDIEQKIKKEFLRQMDLIKESKDQVCVFATTNMPWEMDVRTLKRFERKILVPMPDAQSRKQILMLHAGDQHSLTSEDFANIAAETEGYSGSDLSTLVNDALMRPIKELQDATHFRKVKKREL